MATKYGTAGNDNPLRGTSGNDSIYGLAGNDLIISDDGDDYIEAGDGDDQVNGYPGLNGSYTYYSASGKLTIYGGSGNDFLVGGTGPDFISGGTDNDEIFGLDGNDTLNGDSGKDYISAGKGNDSVYGGEDNDRILTGDGADYVEGGSGDDEINSYMDTDGGRIRWVFSGSVKAYGNSGNDVITGSSGNDELFGDDGNDNLFGDDGNDSLIGGAGNDTLSGGGGNDYLDPGAGINELSGGLGNDTYFVRNSQDFIYDAGGVDTAFVSASFVKIPSSIENVNYTDGALALPYWIDALLPDEAAGLNFKTLLNNSSTINYSFPLYLPSYDTSSKHAYGFLAFTPAQIGRTKQALSYISSVVNLQFNETSNTSQLNTISFANNNQADSAGYAQMPNDAFSGSDVFLNKSSAGTFSLKDGEYQTLTLIHEIGHALGLDHPFSTANAFGNFSDPPFLTGAEDSTTWTVMSYTDSPSQYYFQYSPLDIAALQYIYGPSKTARTANDTYKISPSNPNFIWDGAGTDTLDASNLTQGATVYLNPGYWGYVGLTRASTITSPGQITVNFGSSIENLTGSSFADKLFGTDGENLINGGSGSDVIDGLGGNDLIVGGLGDDQIYGGSGIDTALLSGSQSSYLTSSSKGTFTVSDKRPNSDGVDAMMSVERIKYSDKYVAIDLEANAGTTAKVIGAVLGKDAVKNPVTVGIGLSYADKGMTYSELGALALGAIGASTNDAIVSALWRNIVGSEASPENKAPYIKMLQDGLKPGDLVVMAADNVLNMTNIGLAGLAQTGLEFIPA